MLLLSLFRSLLVLIPLFALAQNALAYPNFISFGYASCTACHYNPAGGGPLTDYGRALGATEISGRLFIERMDEEKIAETSGFLGPVAELPSWLRLSADYRGLQLWNGLQHDPTRRWIHMQAEGSVLIQPIEDRLFLTGTLGYVPAPAAASKSQQTAAPNTISREHYAGYRFSESLGVYAGFMDPVFGVRVPDHNSYIRSRNLLNINDQVHGVMLHSAGKSAEGALHLFVGNLYQTPSVRPKGASGIFEFDAGENLRLGTSAWVSSSSFRARQMAAVHARTGMGKGSAILGQVGLSREKPANASSAAIGDTIFLQTSTRFTRGVYWLLTFEHFANDLSRSGMRTYRAGPGLQYFPMQRFEFRTDFQASRILGEAVVDQDVFTLMSQVHIWL